MRKIDRLDKFLSVCFLTDGEVYRRSGIGLGTFSKCRGNAETDLSPRTVEKLLAAFPELNRSWLLTGQGDMLNAGVTPGAVVQTSGDGGRNFVNSQVSEDSSATRFLDEIARQRELTAKVQEQVDRLLAIIEKMQSR